MRLLEANKCRGNAENITIINLTNVMSIMAVGYAAWAQASETMHCTA